VGDSTKDTFPKDRGGIRRRYFHGEESLPLLPVTYQTPAHAVRSYGRKIMDGRPDNKSCSANGRETAKINQMAFRSVILKTLNSEGSNEESREDSRDWLELLELRNLKSAVTIRRGRSRNPKI
jgi:hypothetical protein